MDNVAIFKRCDFFSFSEILHEISIRVVREKRTRLHTGNSEYAIVAVTATCPAITWENRITDNKLLRERERDEGARETERVREIGIESEYVWCIQKIANVRMQLSLLGTSRWKEHCNGVRKVRENAENKADRVVGFCWLRFEENREREERRSDEECEFLRKSISQPPQSLGVWCIKRAIREQKAQALRQRYIIYMGLRSEQGTRLKMREQWRMTERKKKTRCTKSACGWTSTTHHFSRALSTFELCLWQKKSYRARYTLWQIFRLLAIKRIPLNIVDLRIMGIQWGFAKGIYSHSYYHTMYHSFYHLSNGIFYPVPILFNNIMNQSWAKYFKYLVLEILFSTASIQVLFEVLQKNKHETLSLMFISHS